MFLNKNRRTEKKAQKPDMVIVTDYEDLEIIGLKDVWVNEFLGSYRLMYQDSVYEYNVIYWSCSKSSVPRYREMANKILNAYNRGDKIVEI